MCIYGHCERDALDVSVGTGWAVRAATADHVCVLPHSCCLQSQIAEDGSEVLYVDNNRGHTRSFSSEKIFQDYRAQQVRSNPAPAAPAVPAAALGSASGSPGKPAVVAAGLVGMAAAAAPAAADGSKPSQLSSFDEELPDDAPSLGGGVRLSDPLGVS
jgi:hypothetical protein